MIALAPLVSVEPTAQALRGPAAATPRNRPLCVGNGKVCCFQVLPFQCSISGIEYL